MVGLYWVGYSTVAWMTFWTGVGAQSMRMWSTALRAAEVPQAHRPGPRAVDDLLAEVFPEGVTL